MTSTFESFLIMIFFALIIRGCALKDIAVGTERSSREVQDKQEWKVEFINSCKCSQQELIVSCKGYQSVEKVDPNVFKSVGNN
ncbi:hypothetical protein R6Q57_023812 [Mikania cordata]